MLQALHDVNASSQVLDGFINCGAMARSEWSPSLQRRRLSAYYCHCRHCEPCARSKANKIAANLKKHLKNARANEYRLITLTLKHSDAPLKEQIEKLYKSFRKLRATKQWKKTQVGGAFILEVKWTGRQWHPHLHLVSQGRYLDKYKLSELWHRSTGDSFIVDLKVITRSEDAAHYVTKYITKSTSESVWDDPSAAQEWIIASKGLRTCNTFGSWRKFPLLSTADATRDWEIEDSLIRILDRANAGERIARDMLNTLRPPGRADEADPRDPPPPPEIDPVPI